MVRKLRKGEAKKGLVLANGGMVTYQYAVCLSSQPRNSPYPDRNPLPDLLKDDPVPEVDDKAEGEAIIEVENPVLVKSCADSNRHTRSSSSEMELRT